MLQSQKKNYGFSLPNVFFPTSHLTYLSKWHYHLYHLSNCSGQNPNLSFPHLTSNLYKNPVLPLKYTQKPTAPTVLTLPPQTTATADCQCSSSIRKDFCSPLKPRTWLTSRRQLKNIHWMNSWHLTLPSSTLVPDLIQASQHPKWSSKYK